MEVKIPEAASRPVELRAPKVSKKGDENESKINDSAVNVTTSEVGKDSRGRSEINRAISFVNVTSEAVADVGALLNSVDGIVKQVESGGLSPDRVVKLELESSELVNAIRERARNADFEGVKPLRGEEVNVEVEALSKSLKIIFPDDAKDAFGIETVKLDKAEAIIQTRQQIDQARSRLEALSKSVDSTRGEIENVIRTAEVAAENAAAAGTVLRDADQALKAFSPERLNKIGGELGKVHNLTVKSLELLR